MVRERVLGWIAKFSSNRYQRVILAVLILSALSGFLITRLQFQSDVLHLLPQNAPATGAFVKFLQKFGAADSLFIILERSSGGEVESFAPFAEVLADRLVKTGEFNEIVGRIDPEKKEKIGALFLRHALLYLPDDELQEVKVRLSSESIRQRIKALKTSLHSLFPSPLGRYDPLDFWPLISRHLPQKALGGEMDTAGYLLSEDQRMMLLIAKPKGAAPDVAYDERLFQKIQTAVAATQEEYSPGKHVPPDGYRDLRIGFAGGYMTALEDSRLIRKELLMNFSVSLIGVLILFVLAFRTGVSLFYAILPLAVSPILTLGLFSPFLGRLSESTGAFSAIILGLSIDFIVLLYARYLEERNLGQNMEPALRISLAKTGPGVLTGGVTTAAAYYALLISDFPGIKELGLLTGTGILFSLACAFFLLPALITAREKKKQAAEKFKPLSSFLGLERLTRLSWRHPVTVILLCAVATLATAFGAFQIKLNNDPRRLRPESLSSLTLEARVREKMGEGQEPMLLLLERKTAEEALESQGALSEAIANAQSSGLPITRYENLSAFIPPLARQKKTLDRLEEEGEAFNADRVEKDIRQALQKEGLRLEPFAPALKMLREMLVNRDQLTWEEFQKSPLKEVGARFLQKREDRFLCASYLYVPPEFWAHPGAPGFLKSLQDAFPGTQITGTKLVQRELENLMTREAWQVLLLGFVGVLALIYFDFRSWRLSLVSLLPVALASIWTLGLMGLWKMDLNFMNLVVFTMVLGIGVDYGVHILHRARSGAADRLATEVTEVGKGVVVAALTTLMGFGSLVLSGYPGLRSMGAVALMGVGFSFLISLTLVPVLFRWLFCRESSESGVQSWE